jgi:hypothetical protein
MPYRSGLLHGALRIASTLFFIRRAFGTSRASPRLWGGERACWPLELEPSNLKLRGINEFY